MAHKSVSENFPIEKVSWGAFIINGERHTTIGGRKIGCGKDIRMIGKQVSSWEERKGHTLTKEMVASLLTKDIDILIIGNGFYGALKCPVAVQKFILGNGIKKLIIEKTPKACEIYNKLFAKGDKVALLAHSTC